MYNEGARVEIGSDVALGYGVSIMMTTHDHSSVPRRAGAVSHQGVSIGNGSWIGANVTILPGSIIGAGVVVAAGAVVRGTLEDNCLYAGVPARRIREL